MALERYDAREEALGEELMGALERFLLLQIIDERWREHLFDMDYLREGIHLRGFAQIDPLVAYKNEAFTLFGDLMNSVWADYTRMIFNVQVNVEGAERRRGAGARVRGRGQLHARGSRLLLGRPRARWAPARSRRPPRPRAPAGQLADADGGAVEALPVVEQRVARRGARSSGATTPAGAGAARSSRSATARSGRAGR